MFCFFKANVQLDGRLSQLKSLIGDLTHLDNDCRQLGGWTERRNEELDEFQRKLKTTSDFEAVKNHLKAIFFVSFHLIVFIDVELCQI